MQSHAVDMHEHVKDGRKAHLEHAQDYEQWKARMYNLKSGDRRAEDTEMEEGEVCACVQHGVAWRVIISNRWNSFLLFHACGVKAMQALTLAILVLVVVVFMKSQSKSKPITRKSSV